MGLGIVMDKVAISALEADIVHLALAAVGVLAITVALLVFFGARAISGILTSFANTIKANSALTDAMVLQGNQLAGMVRTLERGQDVQRELVMTSNAIRDAVQSHDGRSDERSKALIEKIDGITDLVGEKVSAGAERVMAAMQPLTDGLRAIKESLEAAKRESQAHQQKQNETLAGIETKIEFVSEQFIDVIQVFGEMSDEDAQQVGSVDGGIRPDGDVSGLASTSTGEPGTGNTGDSIAIGDKPTSGSNDSTI
jgi:hypothetical protein